MLTAAKAARMLCKFAAGKWFQRKLSALAMSIKLLPLSWRLKCGEHLVRCTTGSTNFEASAGLVIDLLLLEFPGREFSTEETHLLTTEEETAGLSVVVQLVDFYNLVTLAENESLEVAEQHILRMPPAFLPGALDRCVKHLSEPTTVSIRFLELFAGLLLLDLQHTLHPDPVKRGKHLRSAAAWLFPKPELKLLKRALPVHPRLATDAAVGAQICAAYAELEILERIEILCSLVAVGALPEALALESRAMPLLLHGRITRLYGPVSTTTEGMLQATVNMLCEVLAVRTGVVAELLVHLVGIAIDFRPTLPDIDEANKQALARTDAGVRLAGMYPYLRPRQVAGDGRAGAETI